ncbi:MAG: hypothetical protein ABI461_02665, partial [Polyangiaceae bacterium]
IGGGLIFFGGIFVVLAISGMHKYLANAKTAEAINGIGSIARDAVLAYNEGDLKQSLCASATEPVPSSLANISGKRYQSAAGDWLVDRGRNAGFSCLKFEMTTPQYFQYDYKRSGSPDGDTMGDEVHAIAHGDLDGDGTYSTYDLSASIVSQGRVDIATEPNVTNAGD